MKTALLAVDGMEKNFIPQHAVSSPGGPAGVRATKAVAADHGVGRSAKARTSWWSAWWSSGLAGGGAFQEQAVRLRDEAKAASKSGQSPGSGQP